VNSSVVVSFSHLDYLNFCMFSNSEEYYIWLNNKEQCNTQIKKIPIQFVVKNEGIHHLILHSNKGQNYNVSISFTFSLVLYETTNADYFSLGSFIEVSFRIGMRKIMIGLSYIIHREKLNILFFYLKSIQPKLGCL